MVITRSKVRSRQTLDRLVSSGLIRRGLLQLQIRSFLNNLFSSRSMHPGSRLTASLAVGNERQPPVRKCCVHCLSFPDLSHSLQVKSNIIGRTYTPISIKSDEIHCTIRNYFYLFTCKNCGIQYVGQSTTTVYLRMNIHQKGKSGCKLSINHYKNVYRGASFSIHILEKPGDGFRNDQWDLLYQSFVCKDNITGWRNFAPYLILMVSIMSQKL